MRWWYATETQCGVQAFNRPCQVIEKSQIFGLPCPQNEICKQPDEVVYIIEDDRDVLDELSELVAWCGYRTKAFVSPIEFQREALSGLRGCVMLDVQLPGIDGLELQAWLKAAAPNLPVVFLSGVSSIETAVGCMRSGAVDFLVKPIRQTDLRRALTAALGEFRKSSCRAQSINEILDMVRTLTPAEWRVAELMAQGYVSKQIANILDRSENTTKIHRFRIFSKLGITSSAQLVKIVEMAKASGELHGQDR